MNSYTGLSATEYNCKLTAYSCSWQLFTCSF